MAYLDFLENISKKFEAKFAEISVQFNFENGPEFEIAICRVLRTLLPNKYGICRGFVVTIDGEVKGDDIIIYDQERFPLLRLLDDNTYEQKQQVPVEAVFAYIEAKNTLYIEGDTGQSLQKAITQCCEVINLPRKKINPNQITPKVELPLFLSRRMKENWPDHQNPIYGIILSRNLKINDKHIDTPLENLANTISDVKISIEKYETVPSIIICGESIICFPVINENNYSNIVSPFFVKNKSTMIPQVVKGNAFSIGMVFLFWAIHNIELGTINWPSLLSKGLGISYESPVE